MRESTRALFNTQPLLALDESSVDDLKRRAQASATRRFRLCLHHSVGESVQEMLIVHCRDNYSRPNRHSVPVTFLILEGSLRVLLFDDDGRIRDAIELSPFGEGRAFALRIESGQWYMPTCITPLVVFYETQTGPFTRDVINTWAPWSPDENDSEAIRDFRRKLGIDD